mmetsp:Transcript_21083/g.29752  ORF Transcript_21083/g.29752 Transcript_21083/m.29752 type:complete len:109 (+) Transcript_21083:217-543(+)
MGAGSMLSLCFQRGGIVRVSGVLEVQLVRWQVLPSLQRVLSAQLHFFETSVGSSGLNCQLVEEDATNPQLEDLGWVQQGVQLLDLPRELEERWRQGHYWCQKKSDDFG